MNPILASSLVLLGLGSLTAQAAVEGLPEIALRKVRTEGTLIFSDCPEYVTHPGILYEGKVDGKGRIYYYHVNDTGEAARLVVYGRSDEEQTVTVTRVLRGDAGQRYVSTGSQLSFRESTSLRQNPVQIRLTGRKKVIAEEDEAVFTPRNLVNGIVEIETEKPAWFGVAVIPSYGNDDRLEQSVPLPPDRHEMRGTFPAEVWFENDSWDINDGPREISLGSEGSVTDFFLEGRDEISFVNRENTGNYGIACHIILHTKGEGRYELFLNPRGGTFEGTVSVGYDKKAPKIFRTQKYPIRFFGENSIEDTMSLGTWEAGRDLCIRFIPPGASYLPVRFLLIPHKEKA